jgi:hypothetical protein
MNVTPKVQGGLKSHLDRVGRLRRIRQYYKDGGWGDK